MRNIFRSSLNNISIAVLHFKLWNRHRSHTRRLTGYLPPCIIQTFDLLNPGLSIQLLDNFKKVQFVSHTLLYMNGNSSLQGDFNCNTNNHTTLTDCNSQTNTRISRRLTYQNLVTYQNLKSYSQCNRNDAINIKIILFLNIKILCITHCN